MIIHVRTEEEEICFQLAEKTPQERGLNTNGYSRTTESINSVTCISPVSRLHKGHISARVCQNFRSYPCGSFTWAGTQGKLLLSRELPGLCINPHLDVQRHPHASQASRRASPAAHLLERTSTCDHVSSSIWSPSSRSSPLLSKPPVSAPAYTPVPTAGPWPTSGAKSYRLQVSSSLFCSPFTACTETPFGAQRTSSLPYHVQPV